MLDRDKFKCENMFTDSNRCSETAMEATGFVEMFYPIIEDSGGVRQSNDETSAGSQSEPLFTPPEIRESWRGLC